MALFDWLFGRTHNLKDKSDPDHTVDGSWQAPAEHSAYRSARSRHAQVPEGTFRFVALDVETACSDVASICQIGIACVHPSNHVETFSMLVNPGTRFDEFNIGLHGIGPHHVKDAPRFPEALMLLLPILEQHHLVQHSNFDKQALNAACMFNGIKIPSLRWNDSVKIARRAWPELTGNGGHGLANLKRVLDLQFQHHDAGEDARAAALVVLHAERHLGLSFEELIKPAPPKTHSRAIVMEGDRTGALAGSVVVFTGTLSMSREAAAEMAAKVGMDVRSGVTKKTTHLVVGDQDLNVLAGHSKSSKHRKAEAMQEDGHPIQIIGETAFRSLVSASS